MEREERRRTEDEGNECGRKGKSNENNGVNLVKNLDADVKRTKLEELAERYSVWLLG